MSQQIITDSIIKDASVKDLTEVNALSKYTITESEARIQTVKNLFEEYFGTNWIQFVLIFGIIILIIILLLGLL